MKKYFVIVLLVLMTSLAFGHPQEPQPDLRDELIQPADNVYRTYGYSNETLALYNIWANQAAAKNYEIRIKKLEEQIAELVKQMAELAADVAAVDPNEAREPVIVMGHGHWPAMPGCKCLDPKDIKITQVDEAKLDDKLTDKLTD